MMPDGPMAKAEQERKERAEKHRALLDNMRRLLKDPGACHVFYYLLTQYGTVVTASGASPDVIQFNCGLAKAGSILRDLIEQADTSLSIATYLAQTSEGR